MFYVQVEKSLEDAFNASEEYSEMDRALFEKIHKNNEIGGDYDYFYDVQCSEARKDLVNLVNSLTDDENVRKALLNNYAFYAERVFYEIHDYVREMFKDFIITLN